MGGRVFRPLNVKLKACVFFFVFRYIIRLTWIQALKKWNEKSETWCIPRKDTEGYNEGIYGIDEGPIKNKEREEVIKSRREVRERNNILKERNKI